MKMFSAIFLATVKEFIRDKSSWFWHLIFPAIFVFIFGWVYSDPGEQVFKIAIIGDLNTEFVNRVVQKFENVDSFQVSVEKSLDEELLKALDKGEYSLIMEVSAIDTQGIEDGRRQRVPLYYSTGRHQTSMILISVVNQIIDQFQLELAGLEKVFEIEPKPVQLSTKVKTNTFTYVLPGILAMALMQLGLFGSVYFLSQREQKIIRGLGVTPLSMKIILMSAILFRLLIALGQTVLIIGLGKTVFGVEITNNLMTVFMVVVLGSLTFISLGYMCTTFVRTLDAGQSLMQTVQFPMIFLSGIFFPKEFLPSFLKPVIAFFPLTYLGNALRSVMVGAINWNDLGRDLFVLSCWLVGSFLVTLRFWKWE